MKNEWSVTCAWCGKVWSVDDEKMLVRDGNDDRYYIRISCPTCGKESVLQDCGIGGSGV